jgi:hypothetical protein
MLHACFTPFASCFVYTSWCFYVISRTNLLTRCHSASSYFLLFCVSEKLHIKYSRNWTNRRPKLLFFLDEGRGSKECRRGARGQAHHEGARPPSWPRPGVVRPPWWSSDAAPPPIKSLPKENPKTIGVFPRTVPQHRRHRRQISGDRSLYSSTLPGRESAPGAISIDVVASSAVSIDFTAISTNLAVSYDEEGVVLPRG